MATKAAVPLSLTPRETSSGLRPPRLAVPPRDAARGAMPALPSPRAGGGGEGGGGGKGGGRRPSAPDEGGDPPSTPSREALRNATRGLRDRRLQKTGNAKFDAKDAIYQSIAQSIRDRTALTLQQALAQPDSANVNAAREQQLQRQRERLEDLRKTFDVLHAELAVKEEAKRMLELQIATDKRAPVLNEVLPVEDGGKAGGAHAMRAPHAPSTPRASSSRGVSRGRPSTMGSVATSDMSGFAGQTAEPELPLSARTSVYDPPLDSAAQLALVRDRVGLAQLELKEMLFQCEVLAHMEHRTRMANIAVEGELDQLRHVINKLIKEDEEIRELAEDARDAMRNATKELNAAREAHADQQRAYADMVEQRSTVISEKKSSKEREKAFEENERAAKLDGKGELDAQGELDLLRSANDITAARVATTIEKETAAAEVSKAEEIYQKLRRSTHDPEAISTPQDLLVTMLSAKDRGIELQSQVDRTEERQHQLGLDLTRQQAELNNYMYFGSSSQLVADAEREFEPQLEAATKNMERWSKRCTSARGLVHDAKIGIALLGHLTHGEPVDKVAADGEVAAVLDRIERHLVSCLSTISQQQNPKTQLGPRAMARMAEANRAAEEAADGEEVDISGEGDEPEAGTPEPLVPRPPPYPKPADSSGDPRQLAMDAALMGKGGNNVRVFTSAEIEKVLETLPEEEPEGIDDEGNELNLTRRTRRPSVADEKTTSKRGGTGGAAATGGAPTGKHSFKTAGAPAAAVRGGLR
jgi:hypothetical protein